MCIINCTFIHQMNRKTPKTVFSRTLILCCWNLNHLQPSRSFLSRQTPTCNFFTRGRQPNTKPTALKPYKYQSHWTPDKDAVVTQDPVSRLHKTENSLVLVSLIVFVSRFGQWEWSRRPSLPTRVLLCRKQRHRACICIGPYLSRVQHCKLEARCMKARIPPLSYYYLRLSWRFFNLTSSFWL